MCGIFGFAKNNEPLTRMGEFKLQGALIDLMILNQSRGKDGTGIYLASKEGSILFKEAKSAGALLKTKHMKDVLRKISGETLVGLGHTRFATVGEVSTKNCHPFLSKDFVGVHNGHFVNRELLLEKYKRKQETEVDSEAIFQILDGSDSLSAISGKLSEMMGDFAIAFSPKKKPHILYLVRNIRPIYAVFVPTLRALLFSSEKAHLEYALTRNFLKGYLLQMKEDTLYEIDVTKLGNKCVSRKIVCHMKHPQTDFLMETDEAFYPMDNPYLFTYSELRQMGYLENSEILEHSKLPCSHCQKSVEAGKLFYDEVSGGSFCEDCSFDYFSEYQNTKRTNARDELFREEQYQFI